VLVGRRNALAAVFLFGVLRATCVSLCFKNFFSLSLSLVFALRHEFWRGFFLGTQTLNSRAKKKISQIFHDTGGNLYNIINARARRTNENQTRVFVCEEKKELFEREKHGEILSPFDF